MAQWIHEHKASLFWFIFPSGEKRVYCRSSHLQLQVVHITDHVVTNFSECLCCSQLDLSLLIPMVTILVAKK